MAVSLKAEPELRAFLRPAVMSSETFNWTRVSRRVLHAYQQLHATRGSAHHCTAWATRRRHIRGLVEYDTVYFFVSNWTLNTTSQYLAVSVLLNTEALGWLRWSGKRHFSGRLFLDAKMSLPFKIWSVINQSTCWLHLYMHMCLISLKCPHWVFMVEFNKLVGIKLSVQSEQHKIPTRNSFSPLTK